MEWSDVIDLFRYWNDSPPTHELVAGYLGYKPKSAAPAQIQRPDMSLEEMRSALRSGEKMGRG